MPEDEAEKRCAEIVRRLRWKGPTFRISGATGKGTKELTQAIMRELEAIEEAKKAAATADAEA
jgi:GTP-binding protein